MVANYTTGKKWADREESMRAIVAEAGELRARAARLAVDDTEAFGAALGVRVAEGDRRGEGYSQRGDPEGDARRRSLNPGRPGRDADRGPGRRDGRAREPERAVRRQVAAATARAALSGSITNITVNAAFLTDDDVSRDLLGRTASWRPWRRRTTWPPGSSRG
jgi:hypothetical protein